MTEKTEKEIGEEIIKLLNLKVQETKGIGKVVETRYGTKTAKGLCRTIKRIFSEKRYTPVNSLKIEKAF